MNGRTAVLTVTFAFVIALGVSAPSFAVPSQTAQLSCPNTLTYTASSITFTSTDNTVQIYINLATGNTWTGLSATIGVGPGGSITGQFTNPSGIASGQGTASGSTTTVTATSSIVAGQWILTITGTVPTGQSLPVTATVQASGCTTTTTSNTTTSNQTDYGWLIYVVAAVVIAVAVILAFVFVRRGEGGAETPTTAMPPAPAQPPTPSPFGGGETTVIQGGGGTKQYYAGFEMPNGQIVPITDINKEFGREDFKSFLPPDVQSLISRRHFKVAFSPRDKTFMIEDLGSANGTTVSGTEIRGKGRVPLKNDDVVSLGGVVNLKFKG